MNIGFDEYDNDVVDPELAGLHVVDEEEDLDDIPATDTHHKKKDHHDDEFEDEDFLGAHFMVGEDEKETYDY